MTAWPDAVWSGPALRDLDARAREEIAAASSLRAIRAGQYAYRIGDRAEQLFAVLDGAIALRAEEHVVREVGSGETFGEEAIVSAATMRRLDALAPRGAKVAVLPAALVTRAIERLGSARGERIARTVRRAVARDRLRSSALARALDDDALDACLDAATHVQLARGDVLFREGDPARQAYVVVEGMIELRGPAGSARSILRAGEAIGESRAATAIAAGPSWVIAIPIELARGVVREARPTDGRALRDPWRFEVARSLLVIDESACVRCGHCAWACATAHDDGVARLVRRGEVIAAHVEGAGLRALLVPASCQHCAVPACVPACPTGALKREPGGEVSLRADLCTGCGACAKACPWDAVRMAPRGGGASVAVKCDLCREEGAGPACVDACPTEAIARIDPRRTLEEARVDALPPAPIGRRAPAWPWVTVGSAAALAIARAPLTSWSSGALAGVALAALFGHGAWKRLLRRGGRPAYLTHIALAPVACAAIARHAAKVPPNAAGALLLASAAVLASGIALAVMYALVPPRLARIERRGALPEDLAGRAQDLEARAFAALTGRGEAAKTVFSRVLLPYARSWAGALTFRGEARESERLRARLRRILAGRLDAIDGLDPLVSAAVEARALKAQRVLSFALRAPLAPHVVAAGVAIALLAAHVAVVGAFR
jgi:Fe-S-cluster-containing dehydrogenase component/CRP-like cAMP-binding protein